MIVLDLLIWFGEVLVRCDRELCARAIDNLIAFGIERAASKSRVTVTSARSGDEARVEIRYAPRSQISTDLPPPGATPSLRRRYIQATYGRGLTLYCVRIAATLLGGRFDVEREDDGRARLCLVASCLEER